jgi:UDP-GlcNAc:undecaprenyl-phosphate GlcNAc-1-phosphate transferase
MLLAFSYLISLLLVTLGIPPIIYFAFKYNTFEIKTRLRNIHVGRVPRFGGLAIFVAVWVPALFICDDSITNFSILLACAMVFALGFIDDVRSLNPEVKFLFQFFSALLIVLSGIRIDNLDGPIQFAGLNDVACAVLSVIFIVAVVNAYNLIDGIDGLAGSLALLVFLVYAYYFYQANLLSFSCLACSLSGAMTGFLFFNVKSRRKIFMGDCGSLFIGLTIAIFSLKMLGLAGGTMYSKDFDVQKIGIVVALLSVPIFDTIRVFILRLLKNRSPFKADDNHVHHRLLSLGLGQLQVTGLLLFLNMSIVAFATFQHELESSHLILLILLLLLSLNTTLSVLLKYKSGRNS